MPHHRLIVRISSSRTRFAHFTRQSCVGGRCRGGKTRLDDRAWTDRMGCGLRLLRIQRPRIVGFQCRHVYVFCIKRKNPTPNITTHSQFIFSPSAHAQERQSDYREKLPEPVLAMIARRPPLAALARTGAAVLPKLYPCSPRLPAVPFPQPPHDPHPCLIQTPCYHARAGPGLGRRLAAPCPRVLRDQISRAQEDLPAYPPTVWNSRPYRHCLNPGCGGYAPHC